MTTPDQILICKNGDHPWSRPARRGPKPGSCPDHPDNPPDPDIKELARYTPDEIALAFAEEIALQAARLSSVAEAHRQWRASRAARPDLVPEDRSPQRQQADLAEVEKSRNAAGWLNREGTAIASVYTPPGDLPNGPSKGGHRARPAAAEYVSRVYEGKRVGQDLVSREISKGLTHEAHSKGEAHPETCGECFLIATDPTHLAHRAS